MTELSTALDFTLPSELEAHEPPEARGLARDGVRLLVTSRADDGVTHARFRDLPRLLRRGDLLVVNDSPTLPAALTARRADGTSIALHFSTQLPADVWVVEPRRVTDAAPGEVLALPAGGRVRLLDRYRDSARLWIARVTLPADVSTYLTRWGRAIAYPYVRGVWPIEAYQTVFARANGKNGAGSAEMPSAGRPFSHDVLDRLDRAGVEVVAITLHTGVASLENGESPYEERYEVSSRAAAAVNAARMRGDRVIAVGTTVVRALESAVESDGGVIASRGWTDLVVTPEYTLRAVDALLTGFHEPKATHLAMLEAVAGRDHLRCAYDAALKGRYLWHEFGDVHLMA
jgi:S-adenosylmethionine:tRNA ribosyltransferase-isomerase